MADDMVLKHSAVLGLNRPHEEHMQIVQDWSLRKLEGIPEEYLSTNPYDWNTPGPKTSKLEDFIEMLSYRVYRIWVGFQLRAKKRGRLDE